MTKDGVDINYQLKPKNIFHKLFSQLNPIRPTIFYEDKMSSIESTKRESSLLLEPFVEKVKKSTSNDNPKILDIGAGSGLEAGVFRARGLDTTSLDLSHEGLAFQDSDNNVQADALTTPFRDDVFGGIFSKDMMTHIHPSKIPNFIAELNRICSKQGVVTLVYADGLVNRLGMRQYQHKQEAVIREAEKLGLELIEQTTYKPEVDDWYHPLRATRAVLSFVKK